MVSLATAGEERGEGEEREERGEGEEREERKERKERKVSEHFTHCRIELLSNYK